MVYDPVALAATPSGSVPIDPTRLVQVNKLLRINNMHLKTAVLNDTVFPSGGSSVGNPAFIARPAVSGTNAQIGDVSPAASMRPFQYPVGNGASPQYTFNKVVQFNPRGEALVNNTNFPATQIIEVGLQLTHGSAVASNDTNVEAVQVTGIVGNVKIFRPQ